VAKLKYSYNAAGVMGHVEQIASCTAFDKRLHVLSNVTSTCVCRGLRLCHLTACFLSCLHMLAQKQCFVSLEVAVSLHYL